MFFTNLFCSPAKKDIPEQWTRDLAMEYFIAYAKFENVHLETHLKINTDKRIRADIGAAEFEYNDSLKILIVRGLIDKYFHEGIPVFKKEIIDKIERIKNNPPKEFNGANLEIDLTAGELQEQNPERLNLRRAFLEPMELNKFVKQVDKMMNVSYDFKEGTYRPLILEVNKKVFVTK